MNNEYLVLPSDIKAKDFIEKFREVAKDYSKDIEVVNEMTTISIVSIKATDLGVAALKNAGFLVTINEKRFAL